MGNPICHFELITGDLAGAKDFYGKVFDWNLNEAYAEAGMPYTLIDTGSEPMGGMMAPPEPGIPTAWSVYFKVDDLAAACAKVGESGGKIWKEATEIPGLGSFAVASDPQGAYFCLWQDKN